MNSPSNLKVFLNLKIPNSQTLAAMSVKFNKSSEKHLRFGGPLPLKLKIQSLLVSIINVVLLINHIS